MIPRFVQLFLLASLILLVPSLLYLSHSPRSSPYIDPSTGLAYTPDSIRAGENPLNNLNPLAQTSQGDGVDAAQAHGWTGGWNWHGVNKDVFRNPVDKIEGTFKGLVDHWKGAGTSHIDQSAGTGAAAAAAAAGNKSAGAGKLSPATDEKVEGSIMPKMANATAKAALGRATWHFLHTMTLRFPDKPTPEERQTLKAFFESFKFLYPCGDCARHFRLLLDELPPQTGSRMNAALWLCSVHNKVNERLGKPEFPCDKLDETYDCGCGDEKNSTSSTGALPTASVTSPLNPSATGVRPNLTLTPFKVGRGGGLQGEAEAKAQRRTEEGVRALARRASMLGGDNGGGDEQGAALVRRWTDDCLCRAGGRGRR